MTSHTRFCIKVQGIPQPQGALKSIPYLKKQGGMGVSTFNSNEKLEPWRERVERHMREIIKEKGLEFNKDDPLTIKMAMTFMVPNSKNKKKIGYPQHHTVKPDADKLARAILDAFTFATGVDDSRFFEIEIRKWYTDCNDDVGAYIEVAQFKQKYSKEEDAI